MLRFKTVTLRNFRSFGNIPHTFNLNKYQSLFLIGNNGAGKSTSIAHAIIFALYDKPVDQKDKKSSLVNSMNKKDCVVTLEFDTKGKSIKVIRGIKPNIFEIWVNGKLIPETATKNEHQSILEGLIGCSFIVFVNNIILTLAQYKPFINMSAGDRRQTVEQYLDLTLFPLYVDKVKNDIKEVKNKILTCENNVSKHTYNINTCMKVIETLNEQLTGSNASRELLLDQKKEIVVKSKVTVRDLEQKLVFAKASLEKYTDVAAEHNKITDLRGGFRSKINSITAEVKEFSNLEGVCPTCHGTITAEAKGAYIKKLFNNKKRFDDSLTRIEVMYNDSLAKMNAKEHAEKRLSKIEADLRMAKSVLINNKRDVESIEFDLNQNTSDLETKIEDEVYIMSGHEKSIIEYKKCMDKHDKTLQLYDHALTMFSDKGIKLSIIKTYIPIINLKVNEYLNEMNLYLNFKMSDDFKVEFDSPDRKSQTLNSLSSGQQRRVNLAILLAWRYIAGFRNSIESNIILFDEILDPLDTDSTEIFLGMFKTCFPTVNLMVASQRVEFSNLFESTLEFELIGGFTTVKDD